jgi:hypothetical protein
MLPQKLILLDCSHNKNTNLPLLPPTLLFLHCYENQITRLPELPSTLTYLDCSQNKLIALPSLPPCLTELYCEYNQLTDLPNLPFLLTCFECQNNQLTDLPLLAHNLEILNCRNNLLIYLFDSDIYSLEEIIAHSRLIYRFRYIYYSMKFKSKFRDWLYKKVREPQAQKRFHPSYLLEHLATEDANLEEVLANWK